MTQIANLPQIDGTRTSFAITKNARFQFSIFFPFPAGPQIPIIGIGAMSSGDATLTGLSPDTVASLVTGQPVAGYGIQDGTIISAIPSATSVTLSNAPTQSGAASAVTFQPLALDLTGISFLMQILKAPRSLDGTGVLLLELSTSNGLLISGGASGVLSADVNQTALMALPLTGNGVTFVTDIVATASDGGPINLMAATGPASVAVSPGVTQA